MADFDWQLVAALACVLVALVICGRRLLDLLRAQGSSGCGTGGCGSCASSDAIGTRRELVSLDAPRPEEPSTRERAP